MTLDCLVLAGMPKNISAFSVDNFDRGAMGEEKYGRWLGVVYLDGEDVNEEIVREGWADGERKQS